MSTVFFVRAGYYQFLLEIRIKGWARPHWNAVPPAHHSSLLVPPTSRVDGPGNTPRLTSLVSHLTPHGDDARQSISRHER